MLFGCSTFPLKKHRVENTVPIIKDRYWSKRHVLSVIILLSGCLLPDILVKINAQRWTSRRYQPARVLVPITFIIHHQYLGKYVLNLLCVSIIVPTNKTNLQTIGIPSLTTQTYFCLHHLRSAHQNNIGTVTLIYLRCLSVYSIKALIMEGRKIKMQAKNRLISFVLPGNIYDIIFAPWSLLTAESGSVPNTDANGFRI